MFAGGYYHGKLVFPREFPFKPPSIYMLTPSGRFNVNTRSVLIFAEQDISPLPFWRDRFGVTVSAPPFWRR